MGVAQRRLKMVLDRHLNLITVEIPLQDRRISVAAYEWLEKGVPVYLLTTDIDLNDPRDRSITSSIYPADKEKRFQQEIVLGLGDCGCWKFWEFIQRSIISTKAIRPFWQSRLSVTKWKND